MGNRRDPTVRSKNKLTPQVQQWQKGSWKGSQKDLPAWLSNNKK